MPKHPRPGGVVERSAQPIRERMENDPRRSPAQLEVAILDALAAGPLMKWELRERLHEPEPAIYKHLLALKAARQIKVVGRCLDKRAWALTTWQAADPKRQFNPAPTPKPRPKAEKPKAPDSWWTNFAAPDSSWTDFTEAAKQRDQQAGWTTSGDRTRLSVLEARP